MFEIDNHGIRISGTSLYLDAQKKVRLSFVSHAHSDHIRWHGQVIATPATIELMKIRNKNLSAIPLNYHQKCRVGDLNIELLPSGHILGAAQILVENDNQRLIYTGDFKPGLSLTTEPLEVKPADILIMESTFGAPQFVFPKRWQIIEQMVKFVNSCFQNGIVPVIMGYATGKAQEALKILGDLNYQISVHSAIMPIINVYERYGITFANYQAFQGEDLRERILLIPPHLVQSRMVNNIWRTKKLMLTGWAMLPDAKHRYHVDEVLALSDHADFNQLIEFVHRVQPYRVFITHGIDNFIYQLRREGFQADLLHETAQLPLF